MAFWEYIHILICFVYFKYFLYDDCVEVLLVLSEESCNFINYTVFEEKLYVLEEKLYDFWRKIIWFLNENYMILEGKLYD